MYRTDILEKKEQILQWIAENQSKAYMAQQLNCKQDTLNRYLKIMDIDYKGNQSGKGKSKARTKLSLEEYLSTSINLQTNKIKKKILEENIKPHRCECCGLEKWLNQPIPLELHHIDGDRTHNELDNYKLLCPNCHSFTDSYRGKNSRKYGE